MIAETKVVPFSQKGNGADRHSRARLLEAMQRLQQRSMERLQGALAKTLDQVDDTLFNLADKAGSNALQAVYFEAMREVRLKRRGLEATFGRVLEQSFRAYADDPTALRAKGDPLATPAADDFSLLDDTALEEQVAVDSMVSKAQNAYSLPLTHLHVRLGWLASDTRLTELPSPMSPGPVCEAFRSAAATLDMDIRARLTLFKLFDRVVVTSLGELYADLNRSLVEAGVLPDLKSAPRKHDGQRQVRHQEEDDGEASLADEGEVLQLLRELVGQRKGGLAPSPFTAGSSGQPVSTGELVQTLSVLQQDFAGGPAAAPGGEPARADLREVLQARLAAPGPDGTRKTVGRVEDDVIDIVSLLFDFVLDDRNLPSAIKALIARLQIPMLKVAILDRSFFSKRMHPARRLLNELAQAGIGWNEGSEAGRNSLIAEVEHIVGRVLTEFDDDVGLFARLLEDFQAFVQEERRRAEAIEQRTRQAEEGKSKLAEARKRVDEAIALRMAGRGLPEVAQTLLREAWSRVLFITYLQEGPESELWDRHIQTAEELVWSVEPKRSQDERKRLLATIPKLLQDLRNGLTGISYNPVEMTKLFRALQECHISSLRNVAVSDTPEVATGNTEAVAPAAPSSPTTQVVQAVAAPEPVVEPVPEPQQVAEPSADPAAVFGEAAERPVEDIVLQTPAVVAQASTQDYLSEQLAEVDKIAVGTWMEFKETDGSRRRAKLSAWLRDGDGQRLLFVNRSGVKVVEKSRGQLALDLRNKSASVLDDRLLFDRALEAVVGSLRTIGKGKVV